MTGYARVLMVVAMFVPPQAQTGTVTGQLLNDRGLPAAGVRVAAMPVPREGETSGPTLVGLTLTDSNGRYTIDTLEPGTYYVTAGRVDSPSYYPGVGAVSSAKPILVAAGARISGIDFKTVQPLTHVVSGKVVLQPGQKLVPGSMLPRMILTGAGPLEAPISPDGTFEFPRVQSGQYTLTFSADAFSVPMPVAVEGRVTGIEFRPAAVSVTGSVVMDGAGDAPTVSVSLSFLDIKQNRLMEVAAPRAFAFFASEGEFRVTAKRVPTGYRVKSLTAGGVDLRTNSLKLSSTESVVSIALTLEAAPTVAFAGRAISPRGVLQPMRSIRMESGVETLQGVVQPDGSFVFDRIAPGEHTAVIVAAGSEEFKAKVTVPAEGQRDAAIVMPELRQLSARLGVEGNVPEAARPVVTLRFVEAAGDTVPLAIDGSFSETPLKFTLRDGRYRVTATIWESVAGAGTTRVKTLTAGPVDLLSSPLSVDGSVAEIQITVGR